MYEEINAELIIAVESLKVRLTRVENLLLNFSGVTKDSDGVLTYGPQVPPVAVPSTPELPATEPAPVLELETL